MKIILIVLLILILNLIINCYSLKVSDIKICQTHVIPIDGKIWTIKNQTITLYITPNRDSLLLAKFEEDNNNNNNNNNNQNNVYIVEILEGDKFLGFLLMNEPKLLPSTESNGEKYLNGVHHSVKIPKDWVRNNMKIRFFSNLLESSMIYNVNVGQYNKLKMWTLPFYLFGANEKNTIPFSKVNSIAKEIKDELIEKWSISEFNFQSHPIQRIDWPYLVCGPRNNKFPAYLMTGAEQKNQNDKFVILYTIHSLISSIRNVFGESSSAIQMYAPLLLLDSISGKKTSTFGGVGGSSVGTGDHLYKDVFIHEQGHAFGLPHAGEDWDKGGFYPYENGSLKGSEWGYDSNHNEFLSTFIPTTALNYQNCHNNSSNRVMDVQGRCIKQTVMQSGDGDKSNGYLYPMYADFEQTTIQAYFRNALYYNEGTGSYQKYNQTSYQYYDYKPIPIKDGGLYSTSLDEGTPIERNTDIYTIIFTYSHVGPTSNVSQIYPILRSKGNLIRQFDPTNKTEMEIIKPKGKIPNYCDYSGCDYTLRVTYDDSSINHTLLKIGKRKSSNPTGPLKVGLMNPLSSDSFMQVVTNVKGEKRITLVEVLDTPTGWIGIPINPKIILSKSF